MKEDTTKTYGLFSTGGLLAFLAVIIIAFMILSPAEVTTDTMAKKNKDGNAEAVFAGGCFWCMEKDFEHLDGVIEVISGYSGGSVDNPSYKQVSGGGTGHREVIKVVYDPETVSYKQLLEHFWINVDPFNDRGQFCDSGFQYTAAIYYNGQAEKKLAIESKEKIESYLGEKVVTEVVKSETFYDAEDYHQNYYKTHALKYKTYRFLCGRDKRLTQVWQNKTVLLFDAPKGTGETFVKPSDAELKETLTPIQYKVTQNDGTERPFKNEYWDNKEPGIYVDIVSGEPLFSSIDKYKSGTGWPSFTKPLEQENIVEKKDYKMILPRTEIRSKNADSHVGHVFNDGPEPTGKRYCMNSAALRFVPASDLKKEGYEEYMDLFE